MEASQAGLSGGEAQGQEGGAEAQSDDLRSTLDSLSQGQEELRQFLQSAPWQQQEEAPIEEPTPMDLSFLDPDEPNFDPSSLAQNLEQMVNERAERLVNDRLGPLEQRFQDREHRDAADALVAEFPALGDEKTANEVVAISKQVSEAYGWDAKTANDPNFWRLVYMASEAAKSSNAEQQEPPPTAHMEYGRGAGAAGSEVDLADQVVNARKGRKALPF